MFLLFQNGDVGWYFSWSFEAEEIGLVLDCDHVLCLLGDWIAVASRIGYILKSAVKLSAKKVRNNPSNHRLFLRSRLTFISLLADNQIAIFIFDDRHEISKREAVIEMIFEQRFATISLDNAFEYSSFGYWLEIVLGLIPIEQGD